MEPRYPYDAGGRLIGMEQRNGASKLLTRCEYELTGLDDPTDFAAIELGSALYDRALNHVALTDFQILLPLYSSRLMHMPAPEKPYVAPKVWPYPLGHFDGGKR